MKKLYARIRVVLTAAPFYLVTGSAVVVEVADELADHVPAGWQDNVVSISGFVVGVCAAAVLIIRRVTPFLGEHGLLPPGE